MNSAGSSPGRRGLLLGFCSRGCRRQWLIATVAALLAVTSLVCALLRLSEPLWQPGAVVLVRSGGRGGDVSDMQTSGKLLEVMSTFRPTEEQQQQRHEGSQAEALGGVLASFAESTDVEPGGSVSSIPGRASDITLSGRASDVSTLPESGARDRNDGSASRGSAASAGDVWAPSGALLSAREALARHPGGGIPRIIHQIYGLFGTPASPGHWDHLIEPGARGPGHRVLTADAQRMLLQLQPLPRWLQQHVSIRSIQGGPQISVRSWSSMNPSYTHILWGLGDVEEMVEAMFPAFTPAFRSFAHLPVLRSDLARYLLVFAFGGVYTDTDTLCLRPIDGWADGRANVSAIVGVEADAGEIPHWERYWGRQLQFCQWTFAAVPSHPLLAHVLFRISQLLAERPAGQLEAADVIHVTGPSVMSDAVYDYLKSKGRDWKEFQGLTHGTVVDDLLLLPITAFSPGVGHMGAKSLGHPEARVHHLFRGSWRKQGREASQGPDTDPDTGS